MTGIDAQVSRSFHVAKALAILMVVTAHFLPGRGLWPAASVGLFIFGFSSGYFTSAKYARRLYLGEFWARKLGRLGPHLVLVDVVLLGIFILQGRQGIWTWQTALNVVGLTGLLNWFRMGNPSPYGAGLWFLTLLLIFYASYPLLRLSARSRASAWAASGAALVLCGFMQYWAPMGHALWLTAWSFVFGALADRMGIRLPVPLSSGLIAAVSVLLVLLNSLLQYEAVNPFLLVATSVLVVLWLIHVRLPAWVLWPLKPISKSLLELYVLHSYLFLTPTGLAGADLAISLAVLIPVSWLLQRSAGWLWRIVCDRLPSAGADRLTKPSEEPA